MSTEEYWRWTPIRDDDTQIGYRLSGSNPAISGAITFTMPTDEEEYGGWDWIVRSDRHERTGHCPIVKLQTNPAAAKAAAAAMDQALLAILEIDRLIRRDDYAKAHARQATQFLRGE